MEYTTNLNLKKPDINEYYNIVEQENENADIIDEAIGKLNSDVGTEELTTEAQDCKGAINELNKNIENVKTKIFTGHAADATYSNNTDWETKNINLASARWIIVSIWDGIANFFNPVIFPIVQFPIDNSISINYGDYSAQAKRIGENQIQLMTSGNIYVYVTIIE